MELVRAALGDLVDLGPSGAALVGICQAGDDAKVVNGIQGFAQYTGKCAAQALVRSLRDTWADTTTAHGRLMLTVLGGLAEFERDLIRARTGEGRARAKENGVRMGGSRSLRSPEARGDQTARPWRGVACRDCRSYNVSGWTIARLSA